MTIHKDAIRSLYAYDKSAEHQQRVAILEKELDKLTSQVTSLSIDKPYEALSLGLIDAIATLRVLQQAADIREHENRLLAEKYVVALKADADAKAIEYRAKIAELESKNTSVSNVTEALKVLISSKWAWLVFLLLSVLIIAGTAGLDALAGLTHWN